MRQKKQKHHSQKECLTIIIPQDIVAEGNVLEVSLLLQPLVFDTPLREFRNLIELRFDGYNEGLNELVHVPELRKFMQLLDKHFPYWFYFINKESNTLRFITGLICDIEKVDTETRIPAIPINELVAFIGSHCSALSALNLSTKEFKNTVVEVIRYYFDGRVDDELQQEMINMILANSRAA